MGEKTGIQWTDSTFNPWIGCTKVGPKGGSRWRPAQGLLRIPSGRLRMDARGRELRIGADFMRARDEGAFPVTIMDRVGKPAAGRLLDGVEHNGAEGPSV
jgi:hypothetical protein